MTLSSQDWFLFWFIFSPSLAWLQICNISDMKPNVNIKCINSQLTQKNEKKAFQYLRTIEQGAGGCWLLSCCSIINLRKHARERLKLLVQEQGRTQGDSLNKQIIQTVTFWGPRLKYIWTFLPCMLPSLLMLGNLENENNWIIPYCLKCHKTLRIRDPHHLYQLLSTSWKFQFWNSNTILASQVQKHFSWKTRISTLNY